MTAQFPPRSPAHSDGNFAHTSFDDPAFDPQDAFHFDDMDDEDIGNMQNSVASFHGLQGQNTFFNAAM